MPRADHIRQSRERKNRGTYQTPRETVAQLKKMNREAILGVIRHIITTAGGVLVTNGTLDENQLNTGAGALAVILGIVWSIVAKKKDN